MQVFGLKSTFLESRKITIQKRELIIEEVHNKLLTIKLLYSMFLTNYYIGAFVWT